MARTCYCCATSSTASAASTTSPPTSLVEEGIVERLPYREPGARERHEYRLTAAGRDLRPVLLAMLAWGDAHRAGPDGPPVRVEHPGCGAAVHVELRCAEGHAVDPRAP